MTISNISVVNIPPSGADNLIIGGNDIAIAYDYLGILPGATQCGSLSSYDGVQVLSDGAGSAGNNNGTAYIYANTISCHLFEGVEVNNSNYVYIGNARDGTPLGNYIGTTSDGTRAAGNAVTGNSTHAAILQNNIYRNGGLPIDLGNNGPTPNGSPSLPGPNNWLPYPTGTFNGTGFFGTSCPNCIVYIYKAVGNPAAAGGGGLIQAIALADSSGNWQRTTPAGVTGLNATFTATDAGGNSSEMSPQKVYQFLPLIRR